MKLSYTIHRNPGYSAQYEHIELRVYRNVDLDSSWAKPCLLLKWQGDKEADHWYGFGAVLEADGLFKSTELFPPGLAILKNLHKSGVDTDNIRAVVDQIGAQRVVCDPRTNEWTPIDKVAPANWQRFMAWVDGSCACSVVASDEEAAQKALVQRFAKNADSWGRSLERMEAWILAGKPIKLDDYSRAPDVRDLDGMLKPMKEPVAKVPEQAAAA